MIIIIQHPHFFTGCVMHNKRNNKNNVNVIQRDYKCSFGIFRVFNPTGRDK